MELKEAKENVYKWRSTEGKEVQKKGKETNNKCYARRIEEIEKILEELRERKKQRKIEIDREKEERRRFREKVKHEKEKKEKERRRERIGRKD